MAKNKELISVATNKYCNTPFADKMCTIIYKDFIPSHTYFYSYAAIYTVSLYHLIKGNLQVGHIFFVSIYNTLRLYIYFLKRTKV